MQTTAIIIALFVLFIVLWGLISENKALNKRILQQKDDLTLLKSKIEQFEKKEQQYKDLNQREETYKNKIKEGYLKLIQDKSISMPWLASMVADFKTYYIDYQIDKLNWSKSTAKWQRAEKLTDLKAHIKELEQRNKITEYLISIYPDLENTFDKSDDINENDLDLRENGFLSKNEWDSLSDTEKNKLAFERYKKRHKEKWEIGRDFERFVGYKFETEGYDVTYNGINKKLQDEGIDLIAENNTDIILIQCKYWSQNKQLHEKHIFQLYGTTIKYKLEHDTNKQISSLFICHTELSQVALKCADLLGVEVRQNIIMEDYPIIKCHKGIYHLPFDQQYDNTINDFVYVSTIEEAEALGCRRAYKWHGL